MATCPAGYATLEPDTNPVTLSNKPGHFASQQGASPGVMGVFDSLFTNGPLGCAQSFGTAYVYGAGNQSAANNYNISPGSPNSAVFGQSFQAADAITPAAVGGGGATTNGSTVALNVTCASFPCTITITLTAPESVVIHAASVPRKKGKVKTLTLGKGKITIKTKGRRKLTFSLSGPARRLLKGKKGHFKISALILTEIEHHTTKVTKTLTLTVKPPAKSKRK